MYQSVYRLTDSYVKQFKNLKVISSVVTVPYPQYSILHSLRVSFDPWTYMLNALVEVAASNPKCVKDLRNVFGDGWTTGLKQAMVNELCMVLEFVDLATRDPSKLLSMESYRTYIQDSLTPGAARYLQMVSCQDKSFFLGNEFPRLWIQTNVTSRRPDVELLCTKLNLNKDLLPKPGDSGVCHLDVNSIYALNVMKDNFREFDYISRDVSNTTTINMPLGEFKFEINKDNVALSSTLDIDTPISKSGMAFNLLYNVNTEGDIEAFGNNIYRTYQIVPNYRELSYLFLYIYTGIGNITVVDLNYGGLPNNRLGPDGNPPTPTFSVDPERPIDQPPRSDYRGTDYPKDGGTSSYGRGLKRPRHVGIPSSNMYTTAKNLASGAQSAFNTVNEFISSPVGSNLLRTAIENYAKDKPYVINVNTGQRHFPTNMNEVFELGKRLVDLNPNLLYRIGDGGLQPN